MNTFTSKTNFSELPTDTDINKPANEKPRQANTDESNKKPEILTYEQMEQLTEKTLIDLNDLLGPEVVSTRMLIPELTNTISGEVNLADAVMLDSGRMAMFGDALCFPIIPNETPKERSGRISNILTMTKRRPAEAATEDMPWDILLDGLNKMDRLVHLRIAQRKEVSTEDDLRNQFSFEPISYDDSLMSIHNLRSELNLTESRKKADELPYDKEIYQKEIRQQAGLVKAALSKGISIPFESETPRMSTEIAPHNSIELPNNKGETNRVAYLREKTTQDENGKPLVSIELVDNKGNLIDLHDMNYRLEHPQDLQTMYKQVYNATVPPYLSEAEAANAVMSKLLVKTTINTRQGWNQINFDFPSLEKLHKIKIERLDGDEQKLANKTYEVTLDGQKINIDSSFLADYPDVIEQMYDIFYGSREEPGKISIDAVSPEEDSTPREGGSIESTVYSASVTETLDHPEIMQRSIDKVKSLLPEGVALPEIFMQTDEKETSPLTAINQFIEDQNKDRPIETKRPPVFAGRPLHRNLAIDTLLTELNGEKPNLVPLIIKTDLIILEDYDPSANEVTKFISTSASAKLLIVINGGLGWQAEEFDRSETELMQNFILNTTNTSEIE